jgi:hypothetical protein
VFEEAAMRTLLSAKAITLALLIGWLSWIGASWDRLQGITRPTDFEIGRQSSAGSPVQLSSLLRLFQSIGTPQVTYRSLTFDEAPNKHQRHAEMLRGQDARLFRFLDQTLFLNGRVTAEGEVAYSTPDSTTLEGPGDARRRMVRFGVTGHEGAFRYGLSYRSAGTAFATLQDQAMRELWGEGQYGGLRLRASRTETWNNVDRDPVRARLRQVNDRVSLAVPLPNWPELSLSYSRGMSSSESEPSGVLPVQSRTDTLEGALSYAGGNWTSRLSSTYLLTNDFMNPVNHTEGLLHAASGSYRPGPSLTLAPSVTFREDRKRWSGVRIVTPAASLSLTYVPSDLLRLAASWSYSATHGSDGLTGNNTISASSVAAWDVEKSARRQATLSFEVAYRGFRDELNPRLSNEDFSGLIRLEIKGF